MVQSLDQAVQGMQSAERISRVQVSHGVLCNCISHALTTEKEEIMGLLLGDTVQTETGETITNIWRAVPQVRNDRRKDRVECSGAQMAEVAQQAERITAETGRTTRVVGWYHSHPHITVLPSHIDVNTQASYQALDSGFVGLIVSCFNRCHGAEEGDRLSVIAFQSVLDGSTGQEVDAPEADDEEDAQMRQALAASRAQMAENSSTAWAKRIIPINVTAPAAGQPDRGHLEDFQQLQAALVQEEWAPYEAEAAVLQTEAHAPAQLFRSVHSSSVVCQSLSDLIQGSLLPSLAALHSRSFLLEQKRMEALKRLERAIQRSKGLKSVPTTEACNMLQEFSKPLHIPAPEVSGNQAVQPANQPQQPSTSQPSQASTQQQIPQQAQQQAQKLPAGIISQPQTPTSSQKIPQNVPQNVPQSLPLDADLLRQQQQHATYTSAALPSDHAMHAVHAAQSRPQMAAAFNQVPTSGVASSSPAMQQVHAFQQHGGSSNMHAMHAQQQAMLPNSSWMGQARDMQQQRSQLQGGQVVGGEGVNMHGMPPPPPPPPPQQQQQQRAWAQHSPQHAQHGMAQHSMAGAMHAQQQWMEAHIQMHKQQQHQHQQQSQQDINQAQRAIDLHFNSQHAATASSQWDGATQAPSATPGTWHTNNKVHAQHTIGPQGVPIARSSIPDALPLGTSLGNAPRGHHTGPAVNGAEAAGQHASPSSWGQPQKYLSAHSQHAAHTGAQRGDGSGRVFNNDGLPKGVIDNFLSLSPSKSSGKDVSPAAHPSVAQGGAAAAAVAAAAAAGPAGPPQEPPGLQPQAQPSTESVNSATRAAGSRPGVNVHTATTAHAEPKLSTGAQVCLDEATASKALAFQAAAAAIKSSRGLGAIGDGAPVSGTSTAANFAPRGNQQDGNRSTSEASSSMHAGGLGGYSAPSNTDAHFAQQRENGASTRAQAQAQRSMHAMSQQQGTATGVKSGQQQQQNGQQVATSASPAPPVKKSYAHATSYAAAASNAAGGQGHHAAAAKASNGSYAGAASTANATSATNSSEAAPGSMAEGGGAKPRGRGGKGRGNGGNDGGGGGGGGNGNRGRGNGSNTAGTGGAAGGIAQSNSSEALDMQRTSRGRDSKPPGGADSRQQQQGRGSQAVQSSSMRVEGSKDSVQGEFNEPGKKRITRGAKNRKAKQVK